MIPRPLAKLLGVHPQQPDFGFRDHRCASPATFHNRDFADALAGADATEKNLVVILFAYRDRGTLEDEIDRVAGFALAYYRLAARHGQAGGAGQ